MISRSLSGLIPRDFPDLLLPWGDPTGPEGSSQLRAGTGWVAIVGLGGGGWGGGKLDFSPESLNQFLVV